MRFFYIVSSLIVVLLALPVRAAPSKLEQIFDPDMLVADRAYLEQVTGVAWRREEDTKTYKVDGCLVTATYDKNSVRSLRLELSPKCTFDFNKFLLKVNPYNPYPKFPALYQTTFGQLESLSLMDKQFMTDCLYSCGNIADPSVYEYLAFPHVNNFLEVMPEVMLVGDPAIDASIKWEKAMVKAKGEDWVLQTKFNCQLTKYDTVAHNAFKKVRITAITVGHNIKTPGHGLLTPWSSADDCSGG